MSAVGQVLDVAHRRIALQFVDGIQPLAAVDGFDVRQQFQQNFAQIADQRYIDLDVLVDLRRINLDVYLLGIRRVSFQVAGNAPRPRRVSATGIPARSAKSRTSLMAPEMMMPWPARITGRFELWINSSACSYSAGAGERSGR